MLVILDFIVLTVDHYFSSVEALRKPDKFAGLWYTIMWIPIRFAVVIYHGERANQIRRFVVCHNEKRDQIYNFFFELIKEANQIRGTEADGEDISNQLCWCLLEGKFNRLCLY